MLAVYFQNGVCKSYISHLAHHMERLNILIGSGALSVFPKCKKSLKLSEAEK